MTIDSECTVRPTTSYKKQQPVTNGIFTRKLSECETSSRAKEIKKNSKKEKDCEKSGMRFRVIASIQGVKSKPGVVAAHVTLN